MFTYIHYVINNSCIGQSSKLPSGNGRLIINGSFLLYNSFLTMSIVLTSPFVSTKGDAPSSNCFAL